MIGDAIDTIRNTTSAVNQGFVPTTQIKTSNSLRASCLESWYVNHDFSGDAILLPHVKLYIANNAKMNKYLPGEILIVYTNWISFYMTTKMQTLNRIKE